jgi:hypothetical protein
MKTSSFIIGAAAAGALALTAGLAIALTKDEDSGPEAHVVALPTVEAATPQIEINTGDGPPLAFQSRMEALTESQRKQLELSITAKGLKKDGPIGVVVWSDGTAEAFRPEGGPPAPPPGLDQGAVDVFVFPEGLPPGT